jgi:hypothetical protein
MQSTSASTGQTSGSAGRPADAHKPAWWRSPAILPAIGLVATGTIIGFDSVTALALTIFEGNIVAAILVAAALAGGWFVPLIGLGREPWRDRLMVGAGLGVGSLSLIVLALGSAGLLNRPAVVALAAALAIAALLRVAVDLHRTQASRAAEVDRCGSAPERRAALATARYESIALTPLHYLWLLGCPFLAIAAMAAVMPPGILWTEEAGGYDVLEYHLAVPKEFFDAGRIFFMPNNVYSNMPSNSEMLSLFMMHLRGDAIEAAMMAQLANVVLAGLFVAASWWAARLYSRRAGIVAGVLAATTPWIAYLAGIAFVEVGMLAMGMLSLGAMLRAMGDGSKRAEDCSPLKDPTPDGKASERGRGSTELVPVAHPIRWAIAAGLLAGLACGYKYTAVPLVALPIGLLALFASTSLRQRLLLLATFIIAAAVTFSPWLVRNVINTGNPVFPLAYSVFGAKPDAWDAELNARWQHAHGWAGSSLQPHESTLRAAFSRTVRDWRLGIVLVLLALLGAIRTRSLGLVVLLIVQIAVWYTSTHLFARFAVVFVLPMVILAARAFASVRMRLVASLLVALIILGGAWNLFHLAGLYYVHTRVPPYGRVLAAHGHTNWFVQGDWPGCEYLKIVNALDPGSRVMLVGEARTFYLQTPHDYATVFNHHPLALAVGQFMPDVTATATAPDTADSRVSDPGARKVLKWLADRGITHVLVNWWEMERLQATYGLEANLNGNLFARLEGAGLARMGDFTIDEALPQDKNYATLYEVTHE